MSRKNRRHDDRTDEQKIADIIEAVANSMPHGISPTGKETAQRILARTVRMPQDEVSRLMPEAIKASADVYDGHRLLINAGRNKQTYKLLKKSRTSDLKMQLARIGKANTAFERAMFELDVELASTPQRALQSEGAAISALVNGFTSRVREFVASGEVADLGEIGVSDWTKQG